jgi:hypothetical protein
VRVTIASVMSRRIARLHLALVAAVVAGLAVAGAVLAALVRLPETAGAPPPVHVAAPAAPLTGGTTPTPGPVATTPVRALAASTPITAPARIPPTPTPTTQVLLTAPTGDVSLAAGSTLVLDLDGTAAAPWNAPTNSNPSVLRPIGVDAEPLALHAVYLAVRPGTAILELDRLTICSAAASTGVCPAQAYRITVTVTGG